MEKNLAKTYDPKDFEDRIYEMWETKGAFHAEVDPDKKPFTIVMPPPNITGQLHMGHALDQTLQDVLTVSSVCRATVRCGCREATTPASRRKSR